MIVLAGDCQCFSYRYLKGRSWKAFLFSYQYAHGGWWVVGKGLVRKLKGDIDLVHNKHNRTFLGVLANHTPLFYKI